MVIAIALSALCSMLEATLLSTPLSYVTGLEEQGVKGAARLKKLKQNPDRPISAILCLNTIAYTVGASKTEPKVYDVVLNELGTDKETTWIFEDALYASKTAKANGYNVVGIYDKSEPCQDELKELVDIYIHKYQELDV